MNYYQLSVKQFHKFSHLFSTKISYHVSIVILILTTETRAEVK